MEPQELQEQAEHAHHSGQRGIGLTTSIVAVLLAIATLLGHRSHTEEVILRTEANDQWAYYQAKKIRSHVYEADAQLAKLSGEAGKDVATDMTKKSAKYDKDAEEIQNKANELDGEEKLVTRRANYFDLSELFLEVSIIFCSIALLTEMKVFWKLSFITTIAGIGGIVVGFLIR
ncbi:MAG TPA: DUF4337 domain-containing protein [Terriglobales bacterium]|jgi:hypothetical protein|nr:DUF4337 domain-containing protein [Terriglobales bacterium]